MAKVQTRRTISVKGITYQRLQGHCAATGQSVSGWLEKVIAEKMDAAGVPVPTEVRPRPGRTYRTKAEREAEDTAAHFSF